LSLLLDTHFWIWWLTPRSPLKSAERNALGDFDGKGIEIARAIITGFGAMAHER
jgi:PIN domain nuclease of toxin-antitoxin system